MNNTNAVQILDNTIRPGDLVMATRASPCGCVSEILGVPWIVGEIIKNNVKYHRKCMKPICEPLVVPKDARPCHMHPLSTLTKIHPPGIEDSTADLAPITRDKEKEML